MVVKEIKEILRKHKVLLEQKYKVKNIGIFGSCARGDENNTSDIDILVDFIEPPDMFEFIQLENFLSSILSVKVDLVTRKALKPLIKGDILKETVYI